MTKTFGSANSDFPAVVAIIPAHDEEETIRQSLQSLFDQQGISLLKVVVVADNCTDSTLELARSLCADHHNLEVIESQENSSGKPGALNQGFKLLLDEPADYILQMDSDTTLGEACLKNAIRLLETRPEVGGVCSRFKLASPPPNLGWASKVLWELQNVEFWFDDSSVISSNGENPRFLSGRVSVFRTGTLLDIYNERGYIWQSRVEDKEVSLRLIERRWKLATGMKMHALTSAPLTVRSFIDQRLRWEGGSIELLGKTQLRHTYKDVLGLLLSCCVFFPLRLYLFIWLGLVLLGEAVFYFSWIILTVNLGFWFYTALRLFITRGCGLWGNLIVVTILPWEMYLLARDLLLVASLVMSIFSLVSRKRGPSPFNSRERRKKNSSETT